MKDLKILVTGASGFIGSFIVEEGLARGYEVWAAVRKSSSRAFLQDERIHFIELDFGSKEQLKEQLQKHRFDYIVHAAGVTKCLDSNDFYKVNTLGTILLTDVLNELQMPLKKLVYVSSLSVFGPIRERQPYREITENDTPQPNTAYGQSKLLAEEYLKEKASFPYIVLRPTGVYGPREKDYFMMAKSIKGHVDFAVGFRQQDITFVYVKDVVQAVFLGFDRGETGRRYFLSDGRVYQSTTFSELIQKELGNPWCMRLTAPVWLLRIVTSCGELIGHLTGRISALNNDKFHILRQRNWRCDITPAQEELGYHPEYQLERGVKETIAWYKENNWL
ncbi:MAG: NAD-dependent epimerase/dehydratase family protein [Prevotella sp.]|nr:NAD-dependent epimerase/dehydratase family protein [Prevotella sp.]